LVDSLVSDTQQNVTNRYVAVQSVGFNSGLMSNSAQIEMQGSKNTLGVH